ncbi:hypothetical protein [Burkholderia seminalis]|uniref:hypothetical protein n=1 Tax=Burkholderia seminalis TaxID=488731 RepID=UPI001CF44DD6|nr:hypothetical protein [Burkholderia seminalis]MCA8429359.1 hypothetical protein [Burkholderia seminalis]
MKTAILVIAAALLAPCVSAHAQGIDPDTAYYVGQEDQRLFDSGRQFNENMQREMQEERAKSERDTERLNREADDFVREQQLQRLRNDLTEMQTQQLLRQ